MSGIWDRVHESLYWEVDGAIQEMRESESFVAMGSEIERALAAALFLALKINGKGLRVYMGFPGADTPSEYKGLFLSPQHQIGDYRVDFVFGHTDFPALKHSLVIECDGHDWHEKTKEQAARDKARDRFLSSQVARVLHFTGSEIYRDPLQCWREASEVMNAVQEELYERQK